jgi:hypothetical protein
MGYSFLDDWNKEEAVQDSLNELNQTKVQQQIQLENLNKINAVKDSIRSEIEGVKESIDSKTAGDRLAEAPIVKGVGYGLEGASWFTNQALRAGFVIPYDIAGGALNALGRLAGYNPGFSGDRAFESLFGSEGLIPVGGNTFPIDPTFEKGGETWYGTHSPKGGDWVSDYTAKHKLEDLSEELNLMTTEPDSTKTK